MYDAGTAQEYIVCSEEDVEVAPEHLSAVEGAALPLVGLTGWRALVTKTGENASSGRNILITGYVSAMLSLASNYLHMLQRVPGVPELRYEPAPVTRRRPCVPCQWPPSKVSRM